MKAHELAKILLSLPDNEIVIRYETVVNYSDVTKGTEDMIAKFNEDMILDSGRQIVLAADLSKDIY